MLDLLTLAGLGFLDALNPFSIAAMAVMLATDKPAHRGLMFIVGTVCVYLPSGFALMEGWSVILKNILPTLPVWLPPVIYILLGLSCLAIAVHLYRQNNKQGKAQKTTLNNLSLPATFLFAITSTVSDLPTALPYFAGANLIARMSNNLMEEIGLLLVYNVIYISPLILMFFIRMSAGAAADRHLIKVRNGVDWCLEKLLPPTVLCFGLYLLIYGGWLMRDVFL